MMEGGMIGPMTEEAAVTAAAYRLLYPCSRMAGTSVLDSAAASATAEPLTPAKKMEVIIFT